MLTPAVLVDNCKQTCIILAGTGFATTEDLSSQRSAELVRPFGRGRSCERLLFSNSLRRRFIVLLLVPLTEEGQFFSYYCLFIFPLLGDGLWVLGL